MNFLTTQVSNNGITPLDIFSNINNTTPPPHPLPQPRPQPQPQPQPAAAATPNQPLSRYENQKRRDWITFCQYLRNHRPPLSLSLCSGAHVLEFLKYLDQFGKTKVHNQNCPFFGMRDPPAPCPCPLRQAWGSLDALIGRLRAAYEEHGGGNPEVNPFGARAVRLFLRDVRDFQSKSRGVSYEKKRKRPNAKLNIAASAQINSDVVATTNIYGKKIN